MKKLLLIVSSLVILSMLVFTLSACNPENDDPHKDSDTTDESMSVTEESSSADESESESESESETEVLDLGPWTLASSTIYCPSDALAWERNSAVYLANAIFSADAETALVEEGADRQILVGRFCLDDEYIKADYDAIGYNGYSVYTVGTRLIITAKTDKGLRAAVDKVIADIGDGEIPADYTANAAENISTVTPDPEKHLQVKIDADTGYDVYQVPASMPGGYRYGPSIMVYEDGSMDAWFASSGCGGNQWDWISYKHSEDGVTWGEEKVVLQPTPNGLDHYSCCDPGVIYFNGYYYLGYTSTVNENQKDNCVFVARSENPDGPFEKWNGEGWGGNNPVPLVYFDESTSHWGAGEPSFVELNGTLYIYYTWQGSAGHMTYAATADSTDPNWPATIEYQGVAIPNGSNDSIDVKYVEEYGKFIAISTGNRLSPNSFLSFFESNDGIHFTPTSLCKKNVYYYCHNSGIAGSPDGHIKAGDKQMVGYAYGAGWGVWNTRFQEVKISLSDIVDLSEAEGSNIQGDMARDERDSESLEYVGITCLFNDVYRLTRKSTVITLYAFTAYHDEWDTLSTIDADNEIKYSGYDENVVKCTDGTFKITYVGTGATVVTATWKGFTTSFLVIVPESRAEAEVSGIKPYVKDSFFINTDDIKYVPQIKAIVEMNDGTWYEAYGDDMLKYSGYDENIIDIAYDGTIIPKKVGKTTVTVSCGEFSYEVQVETAGESLKYDYSKINFADKEAEAVVGTSPNNATFEFVDGCLKLTSTNGNDSFVYLGYSGFDTAKYKSITIEYMVPKEQGRTNYTGQLFYMTNERPGPSEECSIKKDYTVDGEWHTITFDLSGRTGWSGSLDRFRFDFFDACNGGDVMFVKTITFNPVE